MDGEQRRAMIADATLTVIARDGVEHATLATEAGLAIGSVRHHNPSLGQVVETAALPARRTGHPARSRPD